MDTDFTLDLAIFAAFCLDPISYVKTKKVISP